MSVITYSELALDWNPESKNNKQFMLIAALSIIAVLLLAISLSLVKVPEEKRQQRVNVPERIAKFLLEKEKPKAVQKVKPKPKVKLQPKKKGKPKVKKLVKKETDKKPLTKTQKKAREKAVNSGLLALGNELADLMDTADVSAMVGGPVKSVNDSAKKVVNNNKALLLADASKSSSGVNLNKYATTTVGSSKLSQREITRVKQALLSPDVQAKTKTKTQKAKTNVRDKPRTAGVRSEEGITIVFDQNKSQLYSVYNRARRKTPGLKGKIVLEITVAPSGKVIKIKVVSNELNDSKLESRLVSRIKQFNFGAQNVEQITVTYPIEFLPS